MELKDMEQTLAQTLTQTEEQETLKKLEDSTLGSIEWQLAETMTADKDTSKLWYVTYLILETVKKTEKYKDTEPKGKYRSFTAWLKSFALDHKVSEMALQIRYKAGRVYGAYRNEMVKVGAQYDPPEKFSANILYQIGIVTKEEPKRTTSLVTQAADGKMTVKKILRLKKAEAGARPKNGYVRAKLANIQTNNDIKATAADLLQALRNNAVNMWPHHLEFVAQTEETEALRKDKYYCRVLEEMPVEAIAEKRRRRMDAVVFENSKERRTTVIHGFEIKVDKHDLDRDHKATEYAPFVDEMSYYVTADIAQDALDLLPVGWGLYVYDPARTLTKDEWMRGGDAQQKTKPATLSCVVPPTRYRGAKRESSLMTALARLVN